VEYDKAISLCYLHEQIKQMEIEAVKLQNLVQVEATCSLWELRKSCVKYTQSDGAANLIQKLVAVNYALGELGQWCEYKVHTISWRMRNHEFIVIFYNFFTFLFQFAQSFLAALQNDERVNYQLDVKFQASYLSTNCVSSDMSTLKGCCF
jgi:endoribonuclease Dicer